MLSENKKENMSKTQRGHQDQDVQRSQGTEQRPVKVEDLDELKRLSGVDSGRDFFIALNGGLISRKRIQWCADSGRFHVVNGIDDSTQWLTAKQIMDESFTNIGKAMEKGGLYCEDAPFIDWAVDLCSFSVKARTAAEAFDLGQKQLDEGKIGVNVESVDCLDESWKC